MALSVPDWIRPLRREEYDKLVELGAFEDERIELLDGVLVPMTPIGAPHSSAVQKLTTTLTLARRVEVFTEPSLESYREHRTVEQAGSLSPAAFPDVVVRVADVIK